METNNHQSKIADLELQILQMQNQRARDLQILGTAFKGQMISTTETGRMMDLEDLLKRVTEGDSNLSVEELIKGHAHRYFNQETQDALIMTPEEIQKKRLLNAAANGDRASKINYQVASNDDLSHRMKEKMMRDVRNNLSGIPKENILKK